MVCVYEKKMIHMLSMGGMMLCLSFLLLRPEELADPVHVHIIFLVSLIIYGKKSI